MINDIQKSLKEITKWPWIADEQGGVVVFEENGEVICEYATLDDADFLAKSPEYIKYLLDENERLRGVLRDIRSYVDEDGIHEDDCDGRDCLVCMIDEALKEND